MKNIYIIIVIVLSIGGFIYYQQMKPQKIDRNITQEIPKNKTALVGQNKNIDTFEQDEILQEVEQEEPGSFILYEDVTIASLEGKIILDFSASWCPSCRRFKKDVEESLDDIPSDVTIILVDYDDHKDLRSQYGVQQQHTFVQIDNQGNKITLWSGGNTLESMLAKIQ